MSEVPALAQLRHPAPAVAQAALRQSFAWLTLLIGVLLGLAAVGPKPAAAQTGGGGETVEQALCRLIEGAAARQQLPIGFLTQLIWQESSFRPHVVSPAGAQGIAQFMPGTARDRGLTDPFDPEQAIPASAALLADLRRQFGNLGLAAAAYNGGPTRVAVWLAGTGRLPFETENYVLSITGRSADDWRADLKGGRPAPAVETVTCAQRVASLRAAAPLRDVAQAPFAPWGVQLAANFSKTRALASFERARRLYAAAVGDVQPMIIGTRLRTRGTRAFYRIRIAAATRSAAEALCSRIHTLRGACVVLHS